jgi:uncharacterized membrane protein
MRCHARSPCDGSVRLVADPRAPGPPGDDGDDPYRSGPTTPVWISHHWPEDYDRCVRMGRTHVCRRCLVLYPITLVVLVAALAGWWLPAGTDTWVLVLLPLPAVVDFVVEHLGLVDPSPPRLVAVTVPLGIGLGLGLAVYVEDPTSPRFWAVVVGYSVVCLLALLAGGRRRPR